MCEKVFVSVRRVNCQEIHRIISLESLGIESASWEKDASLNCRQQPLTWF